jgi:hypothetical protein
MRVVTLKDLGRSVAAARVAVGLKGTDAQLVNSGVARTASKRALLMALDTLAASRVSGPTVKAR